jgi:hypothetical protein
MKYNKDFIFVFGSNLAGRHGAGAAKFAFDHCGAVYGVGFGPQGFSYAIPTKDRAIKTLPLGDIRRYFNMFLGYASDNPDKVFFLTPIGCGLTGYKTKDMINLIKDCFEGQILMNVVFSRDWFNV